MELYIVIIVALLFSAFFSGMEIAFFSANRLSIELKNKEGKRSGRILSMFVKNNSKFIGTTLIGNNIALVVFSMLMTVATQDLVANITENEIVGTVSYTHLTLPTMRTV